MPQCKVMPFFSRPSPKAGRELHIDRMRDDEGGMRDDEGGMRDP